MMLTDQQIEAVERVRRGQPNAAEVHPGHLVARGGFVELPASAFAILMLCVLALGMAACGPRRLNVVLTQQETLMTVGYSADRSQSIFRADNEAQEYCERRERRVLFLNQDTIYQGQYDEDITAAGRTAGRVVGALGSSEVARASRALSSPTDYKTTFEFLCQ